MNPNTPTPAPVAVEVLSARFDEKRSVMHITVPLIVADDGAVSPRPSGSGKGATLATTGGNIPLPLSFRGHPVKLNLTVSLPVSALTAEGQKEASLRKAKMMAEKAEQDAILARATLAAAQRA